MGDRLTLTDGGLLESTGGDHFLLALQSSDAPEAPMTDIDDLPDVTVECAFGVPWTRDPLASEWKRIDLVNKLRAFDARRGRNRKRGDIEAGEFEMDVEARSRQLDPTNTASPYWPNVAPDVPIRAVASKDAATKGIFRGFVNRWPLQWEIGDIQSHITATDAFKIFNVELLPRSVLAVEMAADAPVNLWTLGETIGTTVADSVGTSTGTVHGDPSLNADPVVDYDPLESIEFKSPVFGDNGDIVVINDAVAVGPAFSIEFWVVCSPQTEAGGSYVRMFETRDATFTHYGAAVEIDGPLAGTFSGRLNCRVWSAAGALSTVYSTRRVDDGRAHHIVFVYSPAGQKIYIDGVDDTAAGAADLTLVPSAACTFVDIGGFALPGGTGQLFFNGRLGHVAQYNAALSAGRIAAHYIAGTSPWAGDLSGERLHRVLDLIGWPAELRNIAVGAEPLAPALLNSQTVLEYFQRIARTEECALYMDGDGKVTFPGRTHSNPLPACVLDCNGGTPYVDLSVDYNADQLVRRAEVTPERGVLQFYEEPTVKGATETFDDSLHAAPGNARAAAFRLVAFNSTPSLDFNDVTLAGRRAGWEQTLGREPGHLVNVVGRPATGDPIVQLSELEQVAHHVDYHALTWDTTWWLSRWRFAEFFTLDRDQLDTGPGLV